MDLTAKRQYCLRFLEQAAEHTNARVDSPFSVFELHLLNSLMLLDLSLNDRSSREAIQITLHRFHQQLQERLEANLDISVGETKLQFIAAQLMPQLESSELYDSLRSRIQELGGAPSLADERAKTTKFLCLVIDMCNYYSGRYTLLTPLEKALAAVFGCNNNREEFVSTVEDYRADISELYQSNSPETAFEIQLAVIRDRFSQQVSFVLNEVNY